MMLQIIFNGKKSYTDLGLVLSSKEIGSPSVKKTTLEIPGADGALDLTEYFGETKYSNRILKFTFRSTKKPFAEHYSTILNLLHGKKMDIQLEDGWLYRGRLSVSAYTSDKGIGKFDIEADCEPYKVKTADTVVTATATADGVNVVLTNSKKKVAPVIETTGTITFNFGNTTKTISAGTFQLPFLELTEGKNTVKITGTGTATFTYREGEL